LRFHGKVNRKSRFRKPKLVPLLIPAILIAVLAFFYLINMKLTPIYVDYAEVQTTKIAAHVINKAIDSRIANILNVNDIIEHVPSTTSNMVTTKLNADIINQVLSDTVTLVQTHLEQAEQGNFDFLPSTENIKYDPDAMEQHGGVVFFVPMGQATGIPLLGNLGPKIPIRFHVIGNVSGTIDTDIREFGINNAYLEVNVLIKVNVQVIVPLATKTSTLEQKIPVAIGLVQGAVPHIFSKGDGLTPPSIEVPINTPPKE
jgi:sporulation protein YunB